MSSAPIRGIRAAWREIDATIRPTGRVFYGWWIAGAASGVQMLGSLLWMQSYGVWFVVLQDEFAWSKAIVSGAFVMTQIQFGLLAPVQGWLVDRFGPRVIMRVGLVIFAAGFMLFSRVDTILAFYLTFALIALGSNLAGFPTVMVSIVNWFNRHRSKAIAVGQLGHPLGGIAVPIIVLALQTFGWRDTALVSGVLVLLLGHPLAQLMRHRPAPHEFVDGIAEGTLAERALRDTSRQGFSIRQAMRTRAFWLISIGHACSLLIVSAVMVHLVPHLTEGLGYSLTLAGGVVAFMTACHIGGQLLGGYFGDRLNKRLICAGCLVAHTVGLLLIAYAANVVMVIAFVLLYGTAMGIRGPLAVALRADYFGPKAFGTILGVSMSIAMIGMSTGPLVAAFTADAFGSYRIGFTILAVGAAVGALCFFAAKPPSRQPD